ncbi:MAG: hypothetical protein ABFS43_15615 [Thermodesulfobacteriota bacterium]
MDYKEILCETQGSVCTLTLNNPEKINALSKNMVAELIQADAAAWNYAKHTIALNNLAEDAQNGIKAFLNKETPEWENR